MENNITIMDKELITKLRSEINKVIIGQDYMVDRIIIGLLTGGHILLEGVPGLAKTLTASTVAKAVGIDFKRIQFTPDLLPADILGTEMYHQKTGEFLIKKGAIFANLVLADEINRAPAKVQSALLEAMQEKQVTIGDITYQLERPFLVIATQNPLEQQGTYPLPEAQQDRFMMKLKVDYPTREEELEIIDRFTIGNYIAPTINKIIEAREIMTLRERIHDIFVDEHIKNYVLDIVLKTREPSSYIASGASPRGSINLIKAAKGRAFLEGRSYVLPDDVKAVVYDVLRHRILLTYEAEAEELQVEDIISNILDSIHLP
ncbi:AAA family ATPase [Wukongibacter sp. M2B1]|uniref:AAA family ATPase n=1 Tax=Wukongibacter sp. M2B1 TaxID=3088895 RepID=UPI003D7A0BC6